MSIMETKPREADRETPHAGRKRDLYTKQGGRKISDPPVGGNIKDILRKTKGVRSWEDQGF